MILIQNHRGTQTVFLNTKKNIDSYAVNKQYLPSSGHAEIPKFHYRMKLVSKLAGTEHTFFCDLERSTNRGAYLTFSLDNITLVDGEYDYKLFGTTSPSTANFYENAIELDRGLLKVYNSTTFDDKYYDEDNQTIPKVKVYKP